MPATVEVDSAGMVALGRRITNPASFPVLHKKIGAIYRSAMMERFNTFARGGGSWAPLAPATVRRRRKKSSSILIDTGILQGALSPTLAPGAIQESHGSIVRLGFGGPSKHDSGGPATIADIASFHQFGGGHLPIREIIVAPSTETLSLMARKVDEWLTQSQ